MAKHPHQGERPEQRYARWLLAAEMKRKGKTLEQIGRHFGVSRESARRYIILASRKIPDDYYVVIGTDCANQWVAVSKWP